MTLVFFYSVPPKVGCDWCEWITNLPNDIPVIPLCGYSRFKGTVKSRATYEKGCIRVAGKQAHVGEHSFNRSWNSTVQDTCSGHDPHFSELTKPHKVFFIVLLPSSFELKSTTLMSFI